ncbi:MAG: filamentous hemagglutinin N-terminal domain-containing protein [Pleurocapsa sp. MO_192.B19]|nr:filamentous hemagglutinin N-terminal domain-containing protein [Pleurocapsa sp. MO_192.B19]
MQHIERSLVLITLPLAIGTTLCVEASNNSVRAQIVPDGTLGAESSVVTPDVEINGIPSDRIDGGATRGANLFHSFQDFNVGEGRGAYFSNPAAIENILSRVTGSNLSEILGTLGVLGDANLFFINPNGIVFGPNARLDVGGSFFASTADSLVFENGFEFSASNPQALPLLTVNIPIGLNFRDNPKEIVNRSFVQNNAGESVGLEVVPGKNLTLVGGNINFEAGKATARGGNIELGGLSESGTVGINDNGSLNFPEDVAKADINLSNAADVDVRGAGGGSITINARNLNLEAGDSGSSFIRAGITADSTSSKAQAGDITISATDNVTVDDSVISNQVDSGAVGNAGGVTITTGSLTLTNGAQVLTSTFGQGDAGDINIEADGKVELVGGDIFSTIGTAEFETEQTDAVGDAGNIEITTGSLLVTDGAQVLARNRGGEGNAGSITITADDTVTITGAITLPSGGRDANVASDVTNEGIGNGNDINITASDVSITEGAVVATSILDGTGENEMPAQAGDVKIKATDDDGEVSLSGSSIFSEVGAGFGNGGKINIEASIVSLENGARLVTKIRKGAEGNGGDIKLTTESLKVTDGSQLEVSTSGNGNAGNITIFATDSVTLDGETFDGDNSVIRSDVGSDVDRNAVGNAGGINITTGSLSLTNGGQIGAATFGQGNAGLIKITATDTVTVNGKGKDFEGDRSGAFSTVELDAVGEAGGVTITTGSLTLTNGGEVLASTSGQGNGGLVTINTASLTLTNGGEVGASTLGQRNAGSVEIAASDTITIDGQDSEGNPSGVISGVSLEALGNGGSVTINTASLSLTNGGLVLTSTFGQGNAGDITVNARESITISGATDFFPSGINSGALISSGNGGNIKVFTNQLTIDDGGTIEASNFASFDIFDPDTGEPVNINGTGEPGNINIQANSLRLSNQGSIEAATQSEIGEAANINLTIAEDIIFENNSLISAIALENANGGNVTINADDGSIVAFPNQNNDIIANAEQGNGGKINITTQAIFGLEERPSTPPNQTNDIDASSEFGLSGTVAISDPEVEPNRGLVELPETVVDPSALIAQNPCTLGLDSEFIITGRGGLTPSPSQTLSSDSARVGWVEPAPVESGGADEEGSKGGGETNTQSQIHNPIVPARGWILNEKGEAILVGYDPTHSGPQRSRPSPPTCPAP